MGLPFDGFAGRQHSKNGCLCFGAATELVRFDARVRVTCISHSKNILQESRQRINQQMERIQIAAVGRHSP
jgi:hypothetical protein